MTLGLLKLPTKQWGENGYNLSGAYLLTINNILPNQLKGRAEAVKTETRGK